MKNTKQFLLAILLVCSTFTVFGQWSLDGNSGTYPYGGYERVGNYWIPVMPQYCGTYDNTDFILSTDNTSRMILSASGNITAENNFTVNEAASILGTLGVSGNSTFSGIVNANNTLVVAPSPGLSWTGAACVTITTTSNYTTGLTISQGNNFNPNLGGTSLSTGGGNCGISARADANNYTNMGGVFEASTNASLDIYAIIGEINVPNNYQGYAYAGYFEGPVVASEYDSWSDAKLKTKITPMESSLDKIKQLKPCNYEFNNTYPQMYLPKGKQDGLIAQEVQKVFPELVKNNTFPAKYDRNGKKISDSVHTLAVNYIGLIPVLIDGIKEQQANTDNQESEIAQLKSTIDSLKAIVASIASQSQNTSLGVSTCSLQQNIPNPFTQSTTIHLTVANNVQNAELKIYSTSGVEIKSFTITARGASQITISANELSAGLYEYVLIADGQLVDSKKMILTN
jgi:hypothetical protein